MLLRKSSCVQGGPTEMNLDGVLKQHGPSMASGTWRDFFFLQWKKTGCIERKKIKIWPIIMDHVIEDFMKIIKVKNPKTPIC